MDDMLRIGICDDIIETVEYNEKQIQKITTQLKVNADIRKCYTGTELLMEIEDGGKFHIILLDIEMERMNGIETARKIRMMDPYVILIFVSAYDQYCKEAISVQPFAFVDKPADFSQMKRIIEDAYKRQITENENFDFWIQKVHHRIPLKSIYYFKSDLRKISVICRDKEYCFYGKMNIVEDILKTKHHSFLRVHKSYLVNSHYIHIFKYEKIILQNGEVLDISKAYRSKIRRYCIEQMDR